MTRIIPAVITRWSPTTKRWVIIGAAAIALLLLMRAQDILGPFIWGGIFAYVFAPLVGLIQRRARVPRPVAVGVLFVALGVGLYALGRALVPLVVDQLRELRGTLPQLIANAKDLAVDALAGSGYEALADAAFDQLQEFVPQGLATRLIPFAIGAFATVLHALVFVISVWFLLVDGPRAGLIAREILPVRQRPELLKLLGKIHAVLGQYVRGQVILIAIMWTSTAIGLSLLGVPFSILIGFITGVLETIPFVGPITAGAIAVVVALGHPNAFGWSQVLYAAIVAAMYTVLRHAEDYFVIPTIIGRIVELHPLVVIFSLLAGGAIAGLLGVVLAVPVAASVRIAALYVVAKIRDEDPYPAIAETPPEGEELATERPA